MSDDFDDITASLGESFTEEAEMKLTPIIVPCASTFGEISEVAQVVNQGGPEANRILYTLGHMLLKQFVNGCLGAGYCPVHDSFDPDHNEAVHDDDEDEDEL